MVSVCLYLWFTCKHGSTVLAFGMLWCETCGHFHKQQSSTKPPWGCWQVHKTTTLAFPPLFFLFFWAGGGEEMASNYFASLSPNSCLQLEDLLLIVSLLHKYGFSCLWRDFLLHFHDWYLSFTQNIVCSITRHHGTEIGTWNLENWVLGSLRQEQWE